MNPHHPQGYQQNIPRRTKANLEAFLQQSSGAPGQLSFTRFRDQPEVFRHACLQTGVRVLQPKQLTYPDGAPILFAFCDVCGGAYYYSPSD